LAGTQRDMNAIFGIIKDLEEDKRMIYLNNPWISGSQLLSHWASFHF